MVVTHNRGADEVQRLEVSEPTLLFYPRPLAHQFHNAPVDGSDFTCASVHFEGGNNHPLARALPARYRAATSAGAGPLGRSGICCFKRLINRVAVIG